MRPTLRCAVTLVIAVTALVGLSTSSPASADPSFIQRTPGTLSPQYEVNGCRYRVRYGGYGSVAYAQVRVYNDFANCATAGEGAFLLYADSTGSHSADVSFADGYITGSDGCGAYREVGVTSPGSAYATGMIAAMRSVSGGGLFNGWRAYSNDGQQTQTPVSNC